MGTIVTRENAVVVDGVSIGFVRRGRLNRWWHFEPFSSVGLPRDEARLRREVVARAALAFRQVSTSGNQ